MNKNLLLLINNIKLGYKYKKFIILAPYNKLTMKLINLLCQEGYIRSYKLLDKKNILIHLFNRRHFDKTKKFRHLLITNIKIVSKPSRKISKSYKDLTKTKYYENFRNFTILSTNSGLLSKEKALELKQGGQFFFTIY